MVDLTDITSFLNEGPVIGELTQGLNLLTTLTGFGTVNIVDSQTFLPVFYGAQPMRVRVRETAKIMSHPVETGVTISDHHVIEPREFELSLIIPAQFYISVYQQIRTALVSAELLTLQTNSSVYNNLVVAEMPHEESPEMFNVLVMQLRLKEVLYIAPAAITTQNTPNPVSVPSNYNPADPVNGNTVNRGLLSLNNAQPNLSQVVSQITRGAW